MLDGMDNTQNKRLLAPERGEPERSGGETNGGSNNRSAETAVPDPEATEDPNAEPAGTLHGPEEILARSEWATVDAVKSGKVFYFDPALITRAGPRILDGLNALYAALYENKQPEFK